MHETKFLHFSDRRRHGPDPIVETGNVSERNLVSSEGSEKALSSIDRESVVSKL